MTDSVYSLFIPIIILSSTLYAFASGTDVFSAMTKGAEKGIKVLLSMLPPLIILFPAIYMLRASGAADAFTELVSPFCARLGIPPETVPLAVIRPFSGSAAAAAAAEIISECGADSLAGRTAAVMLGSSETTFYVIAVYFGAANIKKTKWAVPAALTADLAAVLSSTYICRLLWG